MAGCGHLTAFVLPFCRLLAGNRNDIIPVEVGKGRSKDSTPNHGDDGAKTHFAFHAPVDLHGTCLIKYDTIAEHNYG